MAEKIKSALPPDLDLGGGWVVEWDAVDPATGTTVPGVIVSATSLLVAGDYGGGGGAGAATPYLLVPGPGDSSGLQFGGGTPPPPTGEPPPPPPPVSTPPPPPPVPPHPVGAAEFDGFATQMTELYSHETTAGDPSTKQQSQKPPLWTGLNFNFDDISLIPDARYGQLYKTRVKIGDFLWPGSINAWDGAAQLTIRRDNLLGQWRWFPFGIRIDSWDDVAQLALAELISLGYQTSQGSQLAMELVNYRPNGSKGLSFAIDQNAGSTGNWTTGWAKGTTAYTQSILPVTFGQPEEFVLGCKAATDQTGEVIVYRRPVVGGKPGVWSVIFDKKGIDTELYGPTPNGTKLQDGSNWPTVIDKLGLYFGFADHSVHTETVFHTGFARCTDLATAQAMFR